MQVRTVSVSLLTWPWSVKKFLTHFAAALSHPCKMFTVSTPDTRPDQWASLGWRPQSAVVFHLLQPLVVCASLLLLAPAFALAEPGGRRSAQEQRLRASGLIPVGSSGGGLAGEPDHRHAPDVWLEKKPAPSQAKRSVGRYLNAEPDQATALHGERRPPSPADQGRFVHSFGTGLGMGRLAQAADAVDQFDRLGGAGATAGQGRIKLRIRDGPPAEPLQDYPSRAASAPFMDALAEQHSMSENDLFEPAYPAPYEPNPYFESGQFGMPYRKLYNRR